MRSSLKSCWFSHRIAESDIEEVITTNSTPFATGDKVTALSIAELLADGISRIHNDASVTSLFDIEV